MNIEELLNKYFEGETTCEEERELRRFFSQGIVPEHLQMYRPLFGFLEKENSLHRNAIREVPTETPGATTTRPVARPARQRALYIASSIAAGLILLLGIAGIHRYMSNTPDTYVVIDGKLYSDPQLAHQQALAAFQSVSFSDEEVFRTLFDE